MTDIQKELIDALATGAVTIVVWMAVFGIFFGIRALYRGKDPVDPRNQ